MDSKYFAEINLINFEEDSFSVHYWFFDMLLYFPNNVVKASVMINVLCVFFNKVDNLLNNLFRERVNFIEICNLLLRVQILY